MKKTKETLKVLNYFLSLFNFHLDENQGIKGLSYLLNENSGIQIYDENNNIAGIIYVNDDEINLYAFKDLLTIKAKAYNNALNDGITFSYEAYNKYDLKSLKGKYDIYKNNSKENYIVDNEMNVVEGSEVLYRAKFNSIKNIFKLFDKINDELVVYKNSDFFHRKINNGALNIKNEKGEISYNRTFSDHRSFVFGHSEVSYKKPDYSNISLEFNKILNDIDEEYFDLLRKIKEEINYFGEYLFENSASQVITNDPSILDNILCLEQESNSKKLIRNKKSS